MLRVLRVLCVAHSVVCGWKSLLWHFDVHKYGQLSALYGVEDQYRLADVAC